MTFIPPQPTHPPLPSSSPTTLFDFLQLISFEGFLLTFSTSLFLPCPCLSCLKQNQLCDAVNFSQSQFQQHQIMLTLQRLLICSKKNLQPIRLPRRRACVPGGQTICGQEEQLFHPLPRFRLSLIFQIVKIKLTFPWKSIGVSSPSAASPLQKEAKRLGNDSTYLVGT